MDTLFESLMERHQEKNIISLCKKLMKKCSFNSGADARNLCDLAYWLFVYGYYDDVHAVYEYTTQAVFPGKGIFNVWDYLHKIWGLEIYLSNDKPEHVNAIIAEVKRHYLDGPMYNEAAENLRRETVDFDYVSAKKHFEPEDKSAYGISCRLSGVQKMIGMTAFGIYPKLLADEEKIKSKTEEYLSVLREVK